MRYDTTVLIPAWNAEKYIERAIKSIDALVKVILVDDLSSDNTASIAQQTCEYPISVIQPKEKKGLGLVRQTALDAVDTPYAIWLDADDEYLPGRIDRMLEPLRSGRADFVSDEQELCDGKDGAFIRNLPIPEFINEDCDKVRLFERNWLPGIAHVAFRTELGKQIGYDIELHGGDDSDFVFRAIAMGAKFEFIHEKGYRMYAYEGSDSRKLGKQRGMVTTALKKHDFSDIKRLYLNNGFSEEIAYWGLCSMSMFRADWKEATEFLDQACPVDMDPNEILEPNGPYPVCEGWRYGFTKGTLHLLMDQPYEAVEQLKSAVGFRESADSLNNLGIALFKIGNVNEAKVCFQQALKLFPAYLDSKMNLNAEEPFHITTHPLRMQPSRCEY